MWIKLGKRSTPIVAGTEFEKLVVPDKTSAVVPVGCRVKINQVLKDTDSYNKDKGVLFVLVSHDAENCEKCNNFAPKMSWEEMELLLVAKLGKLRFKNFIISAHERGSSFDELCAYHQALVEWNKKTDFIQQEFEKRLPNIDAANIWLNKNRIPLPEVKKS